MHRHFLAHFPGSVCGMGGSHSPQKRADQLQQLGAGHQLLVEERNAAQKVLVHLLALQHPAHLWEYGELEARDTTAEADVYVCVQGVDVYGPELFGRALQPTLSSPRHYGSFASGPWKDWLLALAHLIKEGELLQGAVLPHGSNGQVFGAPELHLLLQRETLSLMVNPRHRQCGVQGTRGSTKCSWQGRLQDPR